MDISYVETKCGPDCGELEGEAKLVMVVRTPDVAVEITVYGYGSGADMLTVQDLETNEPHAEVDSIVWAVMAPAIAWASPRTIAHLVIDTIINQ